MDINTEHIWVCLWHHKHGTDVGLYETEALAKECMARILVEDCVDQIEYFFDTKLEYAEFKAGVTKLMTLGNFDEIIDMWRNAVPEESFEFIERPLVLA